MWAAPEFNTNCESTLLARPRFFSTKGRSERSSTALNSSESLSIASISNLYSKLFFKLSKASRVFADSSPSQTREVFYITNIKLTCWIRSSRFDWSIQIASAQISFVSFVSRSRSGARCKFAPIFNVFWAINTLQAGVGSTHVYDKAEYGICFSRPHFLRRFGSGYRM